MDRNNTSLRLAAAAVLGVMALGWVGAAKADSATAQGWAGPYVGIAGGGALDDSKLHATSVGPGNLFGVDPATGQDSLNRWRGYAGGFAGWNFPVSPLLVAGIEGDIGGLFGGNKRINGLPGATYTAGIAADDSLKASPDFDATVRGRFGVLVDRVLLYGTAGLAIRQMEFKANCPATSNSWCATPQSQSTDKTMLGWTIGVGGEAKTTEHLGLRFEYRYADFGSTKVNLLGGGDSGFDAVGTKVDLRSHELLLGITYHFGPVGL